MRLGICHFTLIAVAVTTLPSAASAIERKAEKDPNRIVCEKQEVLGSRLATRRVCMTAAEWATKRQNERQMIDRSQIQRQGPAGG